jgi:hypothetical protein
MAGAINRVAISKISLVPGNRSGCFRAIYGVIGVCLYVPNAELALMFIPVPIKAKYFITRF